MVADLKRRFIVCLVLTVPIIVLTPMTRHWLGLESLEFTGDGYVLLALSAFVYGWGGWPFLSGAYNELARRRPAMMTLVAVAISAAFLYSSAVVLGLSGEIFFWELATLVDIMLLGHWLECAEGALAPWRNSPASARRSPRDRRGRPGDMPSPISGGRQSAGQTGREGSGGWFAAAERAQSTSSADRRVDTRRKTGGAAGGGWPSTAGALEVVVPRRPDTYSPR
jgi:hypothetical protein